MEEIIKRDYHVVGTPKYNEVKIGDVEENCISTEVFYRKNLEPKGYYIEARLCGRGDDEHGTFYSMIFDFAKQRSVRLLAKEAGRRGKKAETEAIAVFNEKAKWVAEQLGLEIEEI